MRTDVVEQGGAEAPGANGVQWLLQPRGYGKDGRDHFRHTVLGGVLLKKYADVLGEDGPRLTACFSEGEIPRFWGATPAANDWNSKAQAIRDSRVGDEVLFYNEGKFIGRATIAHKFQNEKLAARLWGRDKKTGAVWLHMIALTGFVEFEADARTVLGSINISGPLRGLTLIPAVKRLEILRDSGTPWSPRPALGGAPPPRKVKAGQAPALGERELHRAFTTLRTHTRPEGPSLHKPLALLWSLGRITRGEARLAPWAEFEDEVGRLLSEFGGRGARVTPHYPFWRLRGDIWEVKGMPEGAVDPGPETLRETDAEAGFVDEAARLLRKARVRAKAVRTLSSRYFDADVRPLVLDRVGLGGYLNASGQTVAERTDTGADGVEPPSGPVGRHAVTSTRPDRNPRLVRDVKDWHGGVCQVCSTPLEGLLGPFSEAAHIQGLGSPHEGPDHTSNMLCLCPNHHTQFDGLAIYIDPQWKVRRTRDDELLFELRLDPQHQIAEEYVEYHRLLCGKED
ncbi:HNH endonuclease [Streptomyces filamentosus]